MCGGNFNCYCSVRIYSLYTLLLSLYFL
jgi:hypothetical protein